MADLHTSSVDCAVAVPLNVQQQHLRHSTLLEYVRVYVCVCMHCIGDFYVIFFVIGKRKS